MRGYDHAALLACAFARRRNLGFTTVLGRADDSVQQGASKAQRLAQAKRAFRCDATKSVPHLLIDDVFTTGATVRYAAEALRNAGASEVYVAVLSRQLLEKPTHL
jgi:predicted amidophosphoribosyltransferase